MMLLFMQDHSCKIVAGVCDGPAVNARFSFEPAAAPFVAVAEEWVGKAAVRAFHGSGHVVGPEKS